MKRNLKVQRRWVAAAGAGVLSAFVLVPMFAGSSGSSTTTAPPTPDTIRYVQQSGSQGTYLQYVPGDGSAPTTQPVTGGGGCATPNTSNPVLAFSARYYSTGFTGPSTQAIVGAYNQRTGVCSVGQAWAIETKEALRFAVGSNAAVSGRLFARAKVALQRNDKTGASATAQLVTLRDGAVVGTQSVSVPSPSGAIVMADTGTTTGFDTLEIRTVSPTGASLSVTGANGNVAVFTLASELCVSDTLETQSTGGSVSGGEVTASLTYVSNSTGSDCKSYTDFSASSTSATPFGKLVNFSTNPTPGALIDAHIDWGTFPYCRPDGAVPGVPTCPTTYVDFQDGAGERPQVFCESAAPPATPSWCTTGKRFQYETVNGVRVTRITEDWSGFGDPKFVTR